jgi:peptidoglycan/xylan/chitin deacetylase (PgdA/CDA1 family)
MGLHGVAVASLLVANEAWPWALGAVAANHGLLTMFGMWPRSTALGPNLIRLPQASRARREIAITLDDGPDPAVTPRVLDLLDRHDVRATFFCIAENVVRHPDLCREIVRRGHAVENHSRFHPFSFPMLGVCGLRREIAAAQQEIASVTGRVPRFFRPPAGLRNPLLDPVLHELRVALVSWTRRGFDTQRGDARRVAHALTAERAAGDILLLHDGNSARDANGDPVVLAALDALIERSRALGLVPVTLDQAVEP